MKQILVPTDFSACSMNALDFAVQSAKILPAEITLVHAFDINDSVYVDYMGMNREFSLTLLNDVENKLASLKKKIKEQDGIDANTIIFKGDVQLAVLDTAKDKNIDLIIMGTLGASGLKEKFWGSKTASVIEKTLVPVMAIPTTYSWHKPVSFLFSTKHFEENTELLNFLFELAGLYMAKVQVAVFTDEDDDTAGTFVEHEKKIPGYEKMLKEQFADETIKMAHIHGKEFEETLQKYTVENDIDILAMITYQKNLWERIFNPSHTKQMSFHTKIPLLSIPAKT